MRRDFSIFDYTITLTRKNRYLIVSCPEFGFQIASEVIGIGELSPDAIGAAVLLAFSRISSRLHELELRKERPPLPYSRRPVSRFTPHEMLSSREAARALGVSTTTLRKLAKQGTLRAIRTPGGHLRFSLEGISELFSAKGA